MWLLGCSQGSGGGAPGKPGIRAVGMGERSEPRAEGTDSRLVYIEWDVGFVGAIKVA